MKSASYDIKDMLVAESLGLTFGTNLFIGKAPVEPANCVVIYDTPGQPTEMAMGNNYRKPAVQILVRNISVETGMELALNIELQLHGRAGETWNNSYYILIRTVTPPFHMEYDDKGRAIIIMNLDIQRTS